jgi:putative colanic acid biosynthesis acetyltransferase WcaF
MNESSGADKSAAADEAALRARRTSPWTAREKLGRALWYVVEATLFRYSPRPLYRWRNWLLRRFGARVHPTARIRPTVTVEVPWHLTVGPEAMIGDHAILYCLGEVTVGARSVISQYAHLCAGTHDYTRRDFPLVRAPIEVGADAWVAADVFVGPGVRVGEGTVVGARSSVFGDLPPWTVCAGSPAKPVKARELKSP